jgi:allophanate hydrolase
VPLGALGRRQPQLRPLSAGGGDGCIALAVVGAHLSGMPLNRELRAFAAEFIAASTTAPDYRLYELAGSEQQKPGLLRVPDGSGNSIAVEIWALPVEAFGRFTAAMPPPLSIGTVRLVDGHMVKGFLVEAQAVAGARDISRYGGWRDFVAQAAS